MDQGNPYSPPVEGASEPHIPPDEDQSSDDFLNRFSLSLGSLCRWMRIAAIMFYVMGTLSVISTVVSAIGSSDFRYWRSGIDDFPWEFFIVHSVMLLISILVILGGVFVQRSTSHFNNALKTGEDTTVAKGFGRVGTYFVFHAAMSVFFLISILAIVR